MENERNEMLKFQMEEDLKAKGEEVEKRERDALMLAQQNHKLKDELDVRRRQIDSDMESLMVEKKEAAEVWKQIEIESHKAVDVEEIISERVNKLVENEKASITKEINRLKKLEKELATREKDIGSREKDHKADKGKISALEADIKRKEEDLVKKEKMLEERKEYLDTLKDSLTKLL